MSTAKRFLPNTSSAIWLELARIAHDHGQDEKGAALDAIPGTRSLAERVAQVLAIAATFRTEAGMTPDAAGQTAAGLVAADMTPIPYEPEPGSDLSDVARALGRVADAIAKH